ncbi:MAG: hypothetical protein AAF799_20970 [Myxococcota bacterium]
MTTTTKTSKAWGAWLFALSLGTAAGACFNPAGGRPTDTTDTVGCPPGTLGCPCDEAGLCIAGLVCEDGTCLDEPTEPPTSGAATGDTGATSVEPTGADSTGSAATEGDTTIGLGTDGTTGDGGTGFGSTGLGSTGEASTGGESSSGGIPPVGVMETVDFPLAGDPRFILSGTRPWNAGDYYEGVRMTSVPSVSQLDVHLELGAENGLNDCGFQETQVSLNGVAVGTFTIAQGDVAIDQVYAAPDVAGPEYTIRYETTTTVESGCGSSGYGEVGSTVTLHE